MDCRFCSLHIENETQKSQGIRQAVRFLTPCCLDKFSRPYKPDVMHFHSFKHAVRHALLASSLPSGTNNA